MVVAHAVMFPRSVVAGEGATRCAPRGATTNHFAMAATWNGQWPQRDNRTVDTGGISVFLADDNLIVREGVRALIERHRDMRVVGVAADYDGVVEGATATEPNVLVTDIRMPPSF